MSGCGCGTSSGSDSKKKGINAVYDLEDPSRDLYWTGGSHAAGAVLGLQGVRKAGLTLAGIRSPNILIFNENPCLKIGSNLILSDLDAAACMDGIVECLSVTAAPVVAGTKYEVATNGNWTGAALDFSSVVSASLCGTSASAAKAPTAYVCGATPLVSNFKGSVYLRPLNSAPIAGVVKVFNGSDSVIWSSKPDSPRPPVQGDSIELTDTAIKGTNKAKVLSVANAGASTIVKLDRAVTGSTRTDNCSTFISSAAKVADLVFTVTCGCQINATLPALVSSDPNFPAGKMIDCGGCAKQGYCVEIINSTPGNSSVLGGQLVL